MYLAFVYSQGRVAKLATAIDSKSIGRKTLRVRVPPCPLFYPKKYASHFI